jgi:hypothetical protein
MPSAPAAAPHLITSLTVGGEAIDDPFDIDGGGSSLVKITFGSLVRGQKYSVVGIKEYEDITFTAKYDKTEYGVMVTKRDAKTEIDLVIIYPAPIGGAGTETHTYTGFVQKVIKEKITQGSSEVQAYTVTFIVNSIVIA